MEARLATLPQYSPDQFQPRSKCLPGRGKRSSNLYKNATFVSKKEPGRDMLLRRSMSNPEGMCLYVKDVIFTHLIFEISIGLHHACINVGYWVLKMVITLTPEPEKPIWREIGRAIMWWLPGVSICRPLAPQPREPADQATVCRCPANVLVAI